MATKRKTTAGTSNGKRASASKVTRDPGAADLERAVRELHSKLGWIVRQIEESEHAGRAEGTTWPRIVWAERRATRPGATKLTGVEAAIRAYAERSILENRRRFRAMKIGALALAYAQGKITDAEAIRASEKAREDEYLTQNEEIANLRGDVDKARTELAKWKAAYNVLAWEADVWPPPDTARGQRGVLGEMYEAISKNRALFNVDNVKAEIRKRD